MTRPTTTPPRDTATTPHSPIVYSPHAHQEPIILSAATEFIGCLLHSTPDTAAPVLELITDDDMPTQLDQHALALIRDLVTRGVTPTAAAVLQHALTTGADRLHREQLTGYVIDAKTGTTGPNLRWMATVVLENAYRQAGLDYAQRLQHAATDASLDDYEQALGDRDRLRDLWRRHRIANGDTPVQEVGAA